MIALDCQLGLIDKTNPTGRDFFKMLQRFFDLAVDLEIKPSLWRQFKTPKLKEALHIFDETFRIIDGYVQEAIHRIEQSTEKKSDAEKSVLEKLLSINRKYAVIMAMDMLFAGVDTVRTVWRDRTLSYVESNREISSVCRQQAPFPPSCCPWLSTRKSKRNYAPRFAAFCPRRIRH